MFPVLLSIFDVGLLQVLRPEQKDVLRVLLFRLRREAEAAGNDRNFVVDHNFIVRDRVERVDADFFLYISYSLVA